MKALMPTRVGGTRWLPHLFKALDHFLREYAGIVHHLEEKCRPGPKLRAVLDTDNYEGVLLKPTDADQHDKAKNELIDSLCRCITARFSETGLYTAGFSQDFDPTKAIDIWHADSLRSRRPDFVRKHVTKGTEGGSDYDGTSEEEEEEL
ncbi:unnamed protein product [Leuciscus chuanchicus]